VRTGTKDRTDSDFFSFFAGTTMQHPFASDAAAEHPANISLTPFRKGFLRVIGKKLQRISHASIHFLKASCGLSASATADSYIGCIDLLFLRFLRRHTTSLFIGAD
jgi:hypothetical protein